MNIEIEAKFVNINRDQIRILLKELGATLEQPERLMRRVVIHTPEMTAKNAFLRVRDEGYRTTITYKQFDANTVDGTKELEVETSSFNTTNDLLAAVGLVYDTYQETKRENWRLGDVEIMIDEWPWIPPFLEIEGESEEALKDTAKKLGFDWSEALFGGVANVYQKHYPHVTGEFHHIINQEWPSIRFDDPIPELLIHPA